MGPRARTLALACVIALATAAARAQGSLSLSNFADDQPVRALVSGWEPFTDVPVGQEARRQALAATARRTQDGVAAALSAQGERSVAMRRYRYLPIVTVTAKAGTLRALQAGHPGLAVEPEGRKELTLVDTDDLTGAIDAWHAGVTGKGVYVAVLDTGVEANHPFLAGRVVEEACFSFTKCPNGQERMIGPGAARPIYKHGTHVAGIIAGRNEKFAGMAPDAKVIAVRVFSQQGKQMGAADSDILDGISYVVGLAIEKKLPIAAMNLSLGTKDEFAEPCEGSFYEKAAETALAAGIVFVASAGNEHHTEGLGQPACAPHALSVGAIDKRGAIADFSDSAGYLKVLAPGVSILSSISGSPSQRYEAADGTSMAAPHIAGALALMRQAKPGLSPEDLVKALLAKAPVIEDPRNGVRTPELDLRAALTPGPIAAPAPQPPPPVRRPEPAPEAPAPAPPAPAPSPQPSAGWGSITQ